jgi:hypothetical protein
MEWYARHGPPGDIGSGLLAYVYVHVPEVVKGDARSPMLFTQGPTVRIEADPTSGLPFKPGWRDV